MSFLQSLPRPVATYHTKTYDRISPSKAGFDATGKTILITGGATGIGLAISKSFAEAGVHRIVIVSRSPDPQAKAKEEINASFPRVEVVTLEASLTDRPRMEEILRTVGTIDVLVLCAAVSHQMIATVDVPVSEFDDTFNTNVLGNFSLLTSYLKMPNPRSASKTAIHISSGSAHMQLPHQIGYGASKAAFSQMMSGMAQEFTPEKDNIRFFDIHPGAVWTPMAEKAGFTADSMAWEDAKLPGDFSVWLAGPESTFLNGRFVWATWDVDELIALKAKIEREPGLLKISLVQ